MVPNKINKVKAHLPMLESLCKCKKSVRNSIIMNGSKSFINCICECVYNLLRGNIKLSAEDLEKIRKKRGCLRKLVKKSSLDEKKKYLVQHGGFMQILIPAAISAIASIISSGISGN